MSLAVQNRLPADRQANGTRDKMVTVPISLVRYAKFFGIGINKISD